MIMQPKIIQEDDQQIFMRCELLVETEKAIKVQGMEDNEVWLPKSQIEIVETDEEVIEVLVPVWLVEKNPLC